MKTISIMMPMRKPVTEVTLEERQKYITWIEDRAVPESVMEAVRMTLILENRERQAHAGS